jgi:hypothetical protein
LEIKIDCAVLRKTTGMIPSTLVGSSDWGTTESMILADENFNSPNYFYILLEAFIFLEFRFHDKKTPPRNYPILRGSYLWQRLKDFQVKVSFFTIK